MRPVHAADEMTDKQATQVAEDAEQAAPETPRVRWRWAETGLMLGFLLLGVFVMIKLWIDPNGRVLQGNDSDHGIFLFMLAHAERVVFDGGPLFYEDRFNVPFGVNMMANTSILALALPLAPVTHFLGGGVTVVLLMTLGLAGTAAAWYWVLSRPLGRSRVAAAIGAAFAGFGPAMVSHANGHVNFVNNYLLPFIVWQVLRLREPGRAWRGGVILGLLIVVQIFINEEALLFVALTLGIFAVSYALMERAEAKRVWKRFVGGLAVAALTSGVLAAYPLWRQFFGKGTYHGQPFDPSKYVMDLASPGAYARNSLFGIGAITRRLSVSATEDNTFWGPFGLVMIIVSIVILWRNSAMRATAIAGMVLLVMSFGPKLQVAGFRTDVPLPFALIKHVPVIDLVSVSRFAMVPSMVAGVLLAFAYDRIREYPEKTRRRFKIGLVLALVPLIPRPLPVFEGTPMPEFITAGLYKQYVPEGRTLITVPMPEVTTGRTGQRWATLNNLDYATPRGYFMGPAEPPENNTGSWSAPSRYTSWMFKNVGRTGEVPEITPWRRAQVEADLKYWRAAVLVLVPDEKHTPALRTLLVDLFGQPQLVGGAEIWRVNS
ncbi:YfhO family protein [Actinoplanes xinjiangensis]|uniref:DUF6311 domain-containing protein n=1 Tax=Actinoplanes xinjiangensis TaxID=512350 RepID=A0A316F1K8_9ACTN|nr:YfhO family protein [Actinoplanes xinjiangensis]PWK29574.1 hypothetical protein BC793_1457 [Actinoplanes xinjiangensis]